MIEHLTLGDHPLAFHLNRPLVVLAPGVGGGRRPYRLLARAGRPVIASRAETLHRPKS